MSNPTPPQPFDEVREDWRDPYGPQSGPCVVCGAIDYALSLGGPTICPACDCGRPDPITVARVQKQLREHIADLERRLGEREAEADEALCLAEGPSTLLDLARGSLLRGFQVQALTNRVERLRAVINGARAQFLVYVAQHEAKGTPESRVKAETNREWARTLLAAYEDTSPGGGDGED